MKDKQQTKISKYIALLLRHHPEEADLVMDEHGWVDTQALIAGIRKTYPDFDMAYLEKIVREDEKQRYAFNEDKTKIRASQGHSVQVDVELKETEPPEYLFHGTGEKYVDSILEKGLIPGSRLYVHLSKDPDTAYKVGQRHGRPVIFTVRAGDMHKDGYRFYLSANGVWLTDTVPVQYLIKEK